MPLSQAAGPADLFDTADRVKRDVQAFVAEASARLRRSAKPANDPQLKQEAHSEAQQAVTSGLGTVSLLSNDQTPGMGRLGSRQSLQYRTWLGEKHKHTSSIANNSAALETLLSQLEQKVGPGLEDAKRETLEKTDRNLETSNRYTQNRDQYKAARDRFEHLRRFNRGEYPAKLNPFLYLSGLAAIGAGDVIINYYVFLTKFEFLIAIIVTLVVGLIVAVSSHVHGKYFRQRAAMYRLEVDAVERQGVMRELFVVTLAFISCLCFVFWARYSYVAQGAGFDSGFDDITAIQLILSKVGPTMFFNVLAWFMGSLIAFFCHERVPGLRENFLIWTRLNAELDSIKKGVEAKKEDIEQVYKTEGEANAQSMGEIRTRIAALEDLHGQLEAVDDAYQKQIASYVENQLRVYAKTLCDEIIRAEGDASAIAFISPTRGRLNMSEFLATEFRMEVD